MDSTAALAASRITNNKGRRSMKLLSTRVMQDRLLVFHLAVSRSASLHEWIPQARLSPSAQTQEDAPSLWCSPSGPLLQ